MGGENRLELGCDQKKMEKVEHLWLFLKNFTAEGGGAVVVASRKKKTCIIWMNCTMCSYRYVQLPLHKYWMQIVFSFYNYIFVQTSYCYIHYIKRLDPPPQSCISTFTCYFFKISTCFHVICELHAHSKYVQTWYLSYR